MLNKLRAGVIGGLLGLTVALGATTIAQGRSSDLDFDSGNGLLKYLQSSQISYAQGFTHGQIWALLLTADPDVVCVPRDGVITHGQVFDIVKNYLLAHPETRHDSATILIGRALRNAWPCKGRR